MRTPRTAVAALLIAALATLATACSQDPADGPPAGGPTEAGSAFTPSPPPAPEKKSPAAQACADALGKKLHERLDPKQDIAKPPACDRLSKDEYGQEYEDAVRSANTLADILKGQKNAGTDNGQ
jgi:hypothetical protein